MRFSYNVKRIMSKWWRFLTFRKKKTQAGVSEIKLIFIDRPYVNANGELMDFRKHPRREKQSLVLAEQAAVRRLCNSLPTGQA